jgi:hypothetical protein
MAVNGNNLFAGTNVGVFLSTNNGASWSGVGLAADYITSFAVSGDKLFAGGYAGVFLTSTNGASWTEVNEGLVYLNVWSLAVCGTTLFAGTSVGGVWGRPLSDMVASAPISSESMPAVVSLDQNYPNPFNPSTTIKFELPRASLVSLKVYDILGREVSVLVNDRKEPGAYEVRFDGSNLASGVYFYRLSAGTYVETRKLLLVR